MVYSAKTPKIIYIFNKKLNKVIEDAKFNGCVEIINELVFFSNYTDKTKKEYFFTLIRYLKNDKSTYNLALELSQFFKEKLKELS